MKSSTRSTRASPSERSRAERRPRAVVAVLAFAILGCSTQARIAPEYAALRPRAIAVQPVVNETIHQLDGVTFGGLLQRVTIGVEAVNVPQLLRGALEEALLIKEYDAPPFRKPEGEPEGSIPVSAPDGASAAKPLPPPWANLPFEAVLVTAIEAWQASTTGTPAVDMRYRVVLRRLPGLEVLYSNVFEGSYREDVRTRSAEGVPAWIRRSARKVLADLPAGS